jgi:predicted nucleic acid-binding protein
MRRVFADTSYWIALVNGRDQLHEKAMALTSRLGPVQTVTSEMVFAELLNTTSNVRYLREGAAELVSDFQKNRAGIVVPQTAEQFAAALQRYEKSSDKGWSLTDCASFLIMEELGIRMALTHDRHFEQAGFEALLR